MDGGPAERQLGELARRYSVLTRAVVAAGCIVLGLVIVPSATAGFAMVALLAWTVGYTARLLRSPAPAFVAVDVVLLCLAALTEHWTVPPSAVADGSGWVLAVLTITVVAVQWHTPLWAGMVALGLVVVAYLLGGWLVTGFDAARLPLALWLLPQGILSRGCFVVLRTAGRRADAMLAERERRRQLLAVSTARRADEREHQALLHDTVAATLLMVGLGAVPGPRSWLAEQAHRDLQVLRRRVAPATPTDLADLLAAEVSRSPVPVRYDVPPHLILPARVAEAVAGSVREALANVARHALVEHAALTVTTDPLRVEIVDTGRGFDPDAVPEHRRGVSGSIVARMAGVGGRATVRSAPGEGTRVRLEWPDV